MSYTEATLMRSESSNEKKQNFFKLSGLKKGHYIKILIDDSDEDGEYSEMVQVTKVSKEPNGIQIFTNCRALCDEPVFDDGLGYYRRYSQKQINESESCSSTAQQAAEEEIQDTESDERLYDDDESVYYLVKAELKDFNQRRIQELLNLHIELLRVNPNYPSIICY